MQGVVSRGLEIILPVLLGTRPAPTRLIIPKLSTIVFLVAIKGTPNGPIVFIVLLVPPVSVLSG